jgi:hypothetical protein
VGGFPFIKSAIPPVRGGVGFLVLWISKNISNPLFSLGVGDGDIVGADDTVGVGDGVTEGGDDEIEIGVGITFSARRRKTPWGFSRIKSKSDFIGTFPCTTDGAGGVDEDDDMDRTTGVRADADADAEVDADVDADVDDDVDMDETKGMGEYADADVEADVDDDVDMDETKGMGEYADEGRPK